MIFRLEEEAVSDEIKVGDEVEVYNSFSAVKWEGGYTVLAIQDRDKTVGRQWIVVAFRGDVPQVFRPDKVRKPKPAPVVKKVVMYAGAVERLHARHLISYSWVADEYDTPTITDTHKITFNLVDGGPDCNSIKMFKL